MGLKGNTLFLQYGCPDCASIRSAMKEDVFFDDGFKDKYGKKFYVVYAFNNISSRMLLDFFGLNNFFVPVLVQEDGTSISNPSDIKSYLAQIGVCG